MRSEEFEGGAQSARFSSVQQSMGPRTYQAGSTLDQLMPSQNGLDSAGQQRRLVGYTGSASGTSDSTYDKRLWLRNREPTNRVQQAQGG